ncbi:DMT family transporter [Stappia taiwanensis]|uniref:DMT family transporter n=1 Tax=Stappia taiwanensis TaxID=992267 RepID=A0A838XUN7_9HYPH|nr:DMT family transporter [Stappia taiwanensis]MBA4612338.1 DMT family transporter [Stappia taiwanensis]GGF04618.1 membrane protein [Stappia taiwanensis]
MFSTTPVASGPDRRLLVALAALLGGAIAMGISPVFVRHAEVGPFTSAFWRVALALPLLGLWARLEAPRGGKSPPWNRATVIAGAVFAGDLVFWHLSIMNTTIANATFFATLAPVWVMLASRTLINEPVTRAMLGGLCCCLVGAGLLLGTSLAHAPQRLDGDLYGLLASLFFGAYFLAIRFARRGEAGLGAGLLVFRSSLVTCAALFVVAVLLEDMLLPFTWTGVAALLAISLFSHVCGQGLLAFALGALPAGFSALVIFLEAVTAAIAGYLLLGEALTPMQLAGGAVILAGIYIARPRRQDG